MLVGQQLADALTRLPGRPAAGTGYRAIPARFYLTALSAVGSRQRGGRYNPKGQLEALYLSESPVVALQEVEALQRTSRELVGLTFSPKTLLSVQYDLDRVLDLTDPDAQAALATDRAELTAPWLLPQASLGGAPTQRLGLAASTSGLEALRAPSAKDPGAANLVIFPKALLTT